VLFLRLSKQTITVRAVAVGFVISTEETVVNIETCIAYSRNSGGNYQFFIELDGHLVVAFRVGDEQVQIVVS